jgi:hypothetical protein
MVEIGDITETRKGHLRRMDDRPSYEPENAMMEPEGIRECPQTFCHRAPSLTRVMCNAFSAFSITNADRMAGS